MRQYEYHIIKIRHLTTKHIAQLKETYITPLDRPQLYLTKYRNVIVAKGKIVDIAEAYDNVVGLLYLLLSVAVYCNEWFPINIYWNYLGVHPVLNSINHQS